MEQWGADLYGNPCHDCGWDWFLTPRQAVDRVRAVPADMALLLEGRSGDERHPDLGWTPAGYVSHVTDNLRIWAERLAGARLAGVVDVQGYDPDALAEARGYGSVPAAAALWSLPIAADAWARSVSAALEEQVVLRHAKRGPQRAEDVARNNAHDAVHHLWDIRRILAYADGTGGGV